MKMKLHLESMEQRDVPALLPPIAGLLPHESVEAALAQKEANIAARAQAVRNFVSQNATWTQAQKDVISDAVIQLVEAANKLPAQGILPPGIFGSCDKWQAEFMKTNMALIFKLERADVIRVDTVAWDNTTLLGNFVGSGHVAVRITLPDGRVMYLDDGNWGGGDHMFVQSEVPEHMVPHKTISTPPRAPWVPKSWVPK